MDFYKQFEKDLQSVRVYFNLLGRDIFAKTANTKFGWRAWGFLCVIASGFISCTYTMANYDVVTIFTAAIVMFGFFQVSIYFRWRTFKNLIS